MNFELTPVIDIMLDLYEQPRSIERFKEYLQTLQGDTKGDLAIPISGFNPMAKQHVPDKLRELKQLDAEQIVADGLTRLNDNHAQVNPGRTFKVAINLSDDLQGGWTNRFTSDYDSKFKFHGLFNKGFCIPIFWSSESFTKEVITQRTIEYVSRTVYWIDNPKPKTLRNHLKQEVFVAIQSGKHPGSSGVSFGELERFYKDNENSDNYHIIFNFFYGDNASASLKFPTYGIVEELNGFDYANHLANTSWGF